MLNMDADTSRVGRNMITRDTSSVKLNPALDIEPSTAGLSCMYCSPLLYAAVEGSVQRRLVVVGYRLSLQIAGEISSPVRNKSLCVPEDKVTNTDHGLNRTNAVEVPVCNPDYGLDDEEEVDLLAGALEFAPDASDYTDLATRTELARLAAIELPLHSLARVLERRT